jgi:hypothetical protein
MDKLAWLVGAEIPAPKHNNEVIEFLLSRRSSVAATLGLPGPTETQLTTMLTIAAGFQTTVSSSRFDSCLLREKPQCALAQRRVQSQ